MTRGRHELGDGRVVCVHVHKGSMATTERHCTSSREGKVVLSCWISEELRQELDRAWAAQGLRPHGRTQKGMESMIRSFLTAQRHDSLEERESFS